MAQASTVAPPAPHGPAPSDRQLAWHRLQFYGFLHFTVNTFTDLEWGDGDEDPAVFNPTALNARQWARVAHDVGMKGLILTAKHHDGFCLWPSRYTQHSVKNSPWRGGNGDVVREFVEACAEYDLKAGLYVSPWDRNHAEYGRPAYVDYYRRQLRELLTQYGELFEVWFDGANGGKGYYGGAREERRIDGRTYYGFETLWETVRRLQPKAVLFSDAGPDIRWVGNESGYAPDTCWGRIHPEGIFVGEADTKRLGTGDPDGSAWRPAEVDVSIRKGWFHHPAEHPKSVAELLTIYYESVGRGASLLLNLPPDRRGLIPDDDMEALQGMRRALDDAFGQDLAHGRPVTATHVRGNAPAFAAGNVTDGKQDSYWATDDDVTAAALTIDLAPGTVFDGLRIEEYLPLGQRIAEFAVDAGANGHWQPITTATTIGARRLLRFPTVTADALRVRVLRSLAAPVISTVQLYRSATP